MIFKINYSTIALNIHDGLTMSVLYDENALVTFDTEHYQHSLECIQTKVIEFFNKVPYQIWFDSLNDDVFQPWCDDDGYLHDNFKCAYNIYKNCIDCCNLAISQSITTSLGNEYKVSLIEDCIYDQIEEQIINQDGSYELSDMLIKYLISLR